MSECMGNSRSVVELNSPPSHSRLPYIFTSEYNVSSFMPDYLAVAAQNAQFTGSGNSGGESGGEGNDDSEPNVRHLSSMKGKP